MASDIGTVPTGRTVGRGVPRPCFAESIIQLASSIVVINTETTITLKNVFYQSVLCKHHLMNIVMRSSSTILRFVFSHSRLKRIRVYFFDDLIMNCVLYEITMIIGFFYTKLLWLISLETSTTFRRDHQ